MRIGETDPYKNLVAALRTLVEEIGDQDIPVTWEAHMLNVQVTNLMLANIAGYLTQVIAHAGLPQSAIEYVRKAEERLRQRRRSQPAEEEADDNIR